MSSFYLPTLQIDPISFWSSLHHHKLNKFKLDEGPFELCGFPLINADSYLIRLDSDSFLHFEKGLEDSCEQDAGDKYFTKLVPGFLFMPNTILEYKSSSFRRAGLNIASTKVFVNYSPTKQIKNKDANLSSEPDTFFWAQRTDKLTFTIMPISSAGLVTKLSYSDFFFGIRNDLFLPIRHGDDDDDDDDGDQVNSLLAWPIRNFLIFIRRTFGITEFRILPFCSILAYQTDQNKITFSLHDIVDAFVKVSFSDFDPGIHSEQEFEDSFSITGWKTNINGLVKEYTIDFSEYCNPNDLVKSSLSLNLNLMKWRASPHLNLEKIASKRVLICGAGTLGCNIARVLLGWNVTNITFIDNSSISYSNPVRQSLYSFADVANHGAMSKKSIIAAQRLSSIYPPVDSRGVNLEIPMLGQQQVDELNINEVEELIIDSDVIFLVTDSRESRWLPTLLALCHKKLLITIAVGFDAYLVMKNYQADPTLGCYFCQDPLAIPDVNNMQGRALDMACTISRPGLSMIASGLGVELFASCTQLDTGLEKNPLGDIPHQLRGDLHNFAQISNSFPASEDCICCSLMVQDAISPTHVEPEVRLRQMALWLKDPKLILKTINLDSKLDLNSLSLEEIIDNPNK